MKTIKQANGLEVVVEDDYTLQEGEVDVVESTVKEEEQAVVDNTGVAEEEDLDVPPEEPVKDEE